MALQHLHSSTANKRPTPGAMSVGQLAINLNTASPGLFFKDSAGALIKVGPVHVGTTAPNASPAGGGETGNTVGEQWLDTAGGTYVFKVWDGSAWRSESGTFVDVNGDVMTGALGIIAGSAGSPGLYFSGDTNTGLYSPGADQVAISTNGTGRLFVDASGNVGVGTSTPNTIGYGGGVLGIFGSGNNGGNIWLTSETTAAGNRTGRIGFGTEGNTVNKETARIWSTADGATAGNLGGNLLFNTKPDGGSLTERMRLDSSGRLGLGSSSAPGGLDARMWIDQSSVNDYGLLINSSGGTKIPTLWLRDASAVNNGRIVGQGGLTLATGSSDISALTIDGSQRVGIGTTSPRELLDVTGANGKFLVVNGASSNGMTIRSTNNTYNANGYLSFEGYSNEYARFDTSGRLLVGTSSTSRSNLVQINQANQDVTTGNANLGIYTSNSQGANIGAKLALGGQSTEANWLYGSISGRSENNGYAGYLQFGVSDSIGNHNEVCRINSGQEVLIGYTTDNGAYKLQVNSQIFATSATVATSDGRYKENVASLDGCLDLVKALRPVSFTWKEQQDITRTDDEGNEVLVREGHNFPQGTQIGFIAQEVQEVLTDKPWLNSVIKENVRAAVLDDEGNELAPEEQFFGIAEGNLIAVLTNALQEALVEIDVLKAKVAALEGV